MSELPNAKLLTMMRTPDGKLMPYVDGEPILGWIDSTVNTNGTQQMVQVIFHSSLVMFETQRHPQANKMH